MTTLRADYPAMGVRYGAARAQFKCIRPPRAWTFTGCWMADKETAAGRCARRPKS